ncbi:MAG TPA: Clp1/GlmU family protein, partial [Actinomycetota bacterium]|nr:Clp1/GlmU family protein [Actinomycetota bacterium]
VGPFGGAMDQYDEVLQRALDARGVTVLLGGLDTGKTTFARRIASAGVDAGLRVAVVDADCGQSTIGPPGTVGLRLIRSHADLEPESLAKPDALAFVGSTSPQGHLLQLVAGTRVILDRARAEGPDVVVVDTTGLVSGVYGQVLKYNKLAVVAPDIVVGLSRGEELEPLLGVARRFFAAEIVSLRVHPDVAPTSVEQRATNREEAMRRYFSGQLQRWRVKSTVFMPSLPTLFDLSALDRILAGLSDGKGTCIGVGHLEYVEGEGALRLISPVPEAPRALILGSVRLDEAFRARRVDLRNLFGSD